MPPASAASGCSHWLGRGASRGCVRGRVLALAAGLLPRFWCRAAAPVGVRVLLADGVGGRLLLTLAGDWRLASVVEAGGRRRWRKAFVCRWLWQQTTTGVGAAVALVDGVGGSRLLPLVGGRHFASGLTVVGRCMAGELRCLALGRRSPPALAECGRSSSVAWRSCAWVWLSLPVLVADRCWRRLGGGTCRRFQREASVWRWGHARRRHWRRATAGVHGGVALAVGFPVGRLLVWSASGFCSTRG